MSETPHFVRDDVKMLLDMLVQMNAPPMSEVPVADNRAAYAAMKPMTDADAHDLAVKKDLTCPGPAGDIPLRLYDARETRDAGPVIMFYHGGGFVIGDLETHDNLCTDIAAQTDLPVIAVDYRLAPEAPFPAAPDDCEAATRWVASNPAELGRKATGLIPMGDSAGGNLAIVTTNALSKKPADVPVLLQVPLYPVASDVTNDKSRADFADGYLLTGATMDWFHEQYAGGEDDVRNFPMLDDCSNSPPTILCTAGLDPLRDSGRAYAAKLIQSGVDVSYLEFKGSIHGFATLRKAIPSAQADVDTLLAEMRLMLERHSA
jgi:acetyl esterase